MNPKFYVFILLLAGIVSASCKKDMVYGSQYERSFKAWESFKATSGNSYRYMVSFGSWTGYSTETVITVEKGEVVARSFVARSFADRTSNQVVIREEWEEGTDNLGTHDNGFAPATLDEIYHRAKTDWLRKRKDAQTYFETKNNGMISSCGYVTDGCQDDCFNGVTIGFIEKR
ncbi:hypothetical protein DLD77_10475 [Chitinophaga alhagiae]|uniref:Lipoprotein n=1 Tax=Chitinophaga alhagiae TaxID=2203219 RepID=A0ABN5LU00_9BACT|nr:hypothetical protein [Chitinophaga alhagiae]AWO02090.1 hypothetical protein DLD77_10475 [Chitinophaga alhagiae]